MNNVGKDGLDCNGSNRCVQPHSEALPPDLQAHLVSFLRSFLKDELPDVIAGVVREELDVLKQETEAPLDSRQAAARLNVSIRKLDELVAAGELRPLRLGRKRLFPQAQLESFLRKCQR